jgi:hypothetical protein
MRMKEIDMIERCRSVERVRRSSATSFFSVFIIEFKVRIVRRDGAVPCMQRPGPQKYGLMFISSAA